MSSREGHRAAARDAVWLAGLLVTLAGLLGMHGLAGHTTGAMAHTHASQHETSETVARTLSPRSDVVDESAVATARILAARVLVAPVGDSSGAGMSMSATGMCMAVLLLSLIALLVRLQAGRLRPLLFLTTCPARAPVASGRVPDPPDRYVLSVQRC